MMTYHSEKNNEQILIDLKNKYRNKTYIVVNKKSFRVEDLDLNDMDEILKLKQRNNHVHSSF
jgi:hypothetical protein